MDFLGEDTTCLDSSNPLRSTKTNSVNLGGKDSHGFLHKLFSRQPNMPKLASATLEDQVDYPLLDKSEDSASRGLEVTPCPYIRPLGIRLEPRVENSLSPRRPPADPTMSILRKKGESSRAAHGSLAPGKAEEQSQSGLSASDIMNLRSLRLREDIAAAATADSSYLKDWGYYIKCYAEGRYSLTAPPGPPPMNANFKFLPSTYPPNELERFEALQSSQIWSGTDIEWSELEAERARCLITAAANKFGTPWGAISFFDHDTEIVQAERGYSRHFIPRYESIASHVLLTDEVMIVLDARKDWRFVGNPLVTGNPGIRFFAGAPLLSTNGQVIGVFAIFSPEPLASFGSAQRRDLRSLSELAAQGLIIRSKISSRIEDLGKVILQRDSCDDSATSSSSPASSPQPPVKAKRRGASSTALQYRKTSQNRKSRPRVFSNSDNRDASVQNQEYTPPSSEDSDAGPSPILKRHRGFGKSREQLSPTAFLNLTLSDTETPDSPTFGEFPPNLNPPQQRVFPVSASETDKPLNGVVHNGLDPYQEALNVGGPSSADLSHEKVHGAADSHAEARFAAELWAKNLEFDTIYAVELISKRISMSESELRVPGNIETRILVSYGLDEATKFDIRIHLNVLRGSGALTWQNKNRAPKEYRAGFMVPLHFESGMSDDHSLGVVFGAFRKAPDDIRERSSLRAAEVERLRQAADVLQAILSKSTSRRRPRQRATDDAPPEPSPPPFPANEAVELGTRPVDAQIAMCAAKRKPRRR